MFGRSKSTHSKESATAKEAGSSAVGSIFARLKNGLSKTRGRVAAGVQTLVLGEAAIDQAVLDDVEARCTSFECGVDSSRSESGHSIRERQNLRH